MLDVAIPNPVALAPQLWNRHERSVDVPCHAQVAATASRSAAALLAADAEWREGLDHARGDRAALRSASRRLRIEPSAVAGVSVAEPEQQDSGDPRSEW